MRRASSSANVGLNIDEDGAALPPPPSPVKKPQWLRHVGELVTFCLAPRAAPHGEDAEGERSSRDLLKRQRTTPMMQRCIPSSGPGFGEVAEAASPPANGAASSCYYAGIGRPWSLEREVVFRRRLGDAEAVLVLLRHGESDWNAADRFTGWRDVGLTDRGRAEATRAGETLAATGLAAVDDLHSSALRRTVDTLALTVEALGLRLPAEASHGHVFDKPKLTFCRSWQLNERHYGHLTGMAKADARSRYGADAVARWRRGWRETPPPMAPDHDAYASIADAYRAAGGDASELPASESLAATEKRVISYLERQVLPQLRRGRTVLVASHNNVIRTIIHHLDRSAKGDDLEAGDPDLEEQLRHLEIPYATPLVYTFALPAGPAGNLYPFSDEMQRGVIRGTFLTK